MSTRFPTAMFDHYITEGNSDLMLENPMPCFLLSRRLTGLNDIACHELDDQEGQGETQ